MFSLFRRDLQRRYCESRSCANHSNNSPIPTNNALLKTLWVVALVGSSVGAEIIPVLDGDFERLVRLDSNWLEGPAYDRIGGVWFSDLVRRPLAPNRPTRLMRFDIASGSAEVMTEGESTNGLAFDTAGNLLAAHRFGGKVTSRSLDDLENPLTIASDWNGRRFDEPNDLVVASNGGIYFTNAGFENSAIFYVPPSGDPRRVATGLSFANGIALSPNEQKLYVAESNRQQIRAYDINEDWSLSNPNLNRKSGHEWRFES